MARTCPNCNRELTPQLVELIGLDVCDQCAGVFFDDGELKKLSDAFPGALSQTDALFRSQTPEMVEKSTGPKLCPNCHVAMENYRYLYTSPIVLDSCDKCFGIWVEDGELRAMDQVLQEAESQVANPQLDRLIEHQLRAAEEQVKHDAFMQKNKTFYRVARVLSLRRSSLS